MKNLLIKIASLLSLCLASGAYSVLNNQIDMNDIVNGNDYYNENNLIFQYQMKLESSANSIRFDNEKVLRLTVTNEDQWEAIQKASNELPIDIWSKSAAEDAGKDVTIVDVRVPSDYHDNFMNIVKQYKISHSVYIENIQKLIDIEEEQMKQARNSFSSGYDKSWLKLDATEDPFFKSYHSMDDILQFLNTVHEEFPQLTELVTIGKTFENRDIVGIMLHGSSAETSKKYIVYHGGQHAREWIGVAVQCYFIRQFLTEYVNSEAKGHVSTKSLLDNYTILIIPVLNVDGYIYTHEKNRMWRKNRQPNSNGFGFCTGTDPNRNWDSAWGQSGASGNPCSEAFYGKSPFSAPEPKAMADYLLSLQSREGCEVVSYIDFHAYSQLWMYPFGYSCSQKLPDLADVKGAGEKAVNALSSVHKTRFKLGGVCNIIYQASGGSLDWTYEKGGIKYSYAVELRDTGKHGFILPPDQIVPSGEETFAAIKALNAFILNN